MTKGEIRTYFDTLEDGEGDAKDGLTFAGFEQMYTLQSENEPAETWKSVVYLLSPSPRPLLYVGDRSYRGCLKSELTPVETSSPSAFQRSRPTRLQRVARPGLHALGPVKESQWILQNSTSSLLPPLQEGRSVRRSALRRRRPFAGSSRGSRGRETRLGRFESRGEERLPSALPNHIFRGSTSRSRRFGNKIECGSDALLARSFKSSHSRRESKSGV